jgi:hypothetical protein
METITYKQKVSMVHIMLYSFKGNRPWRERSSSCCTCRAAKVVLYWQVPHYRHEAEAVGINPAGFARKRKSGGRACSKSGKDDGYLH